MRKAAQFAEPPAWISKQLIEVWVPTGGFETLPKRTLKPGTLAFNVFNEEKDTSKVLKEPGGDTSLPPEPTRVTWEPEPPPEPPPDGFGSVFELVQAR